MGIHQTLSLVFCTKPRPLTRALQTLPLHLHHFHVEPRSPSPPLSTAAIARKAPAGTFEPVSASCPRCPCPARHVEPGRRKYRVSWDEASIKGEVVHGDRVCVVLGRLVVGLQVEDVRTSGQVSGHQDWSSLRRSVMAELQIHETLVLLEPGTGASCFVHYIGLAIVGARRLDPQPTFA